MSHGSAQLQRTPLFAHHVQAGGRMVDFAGWEMPVRYGDGTLAEHHAVRDSAGVFDVSHMGEIRVSGPTAHADLQRLLSNDLTRLTANDQAQYTLLTNESGGIEDDLIVYRVDADEYLLVVNASNAPHDLEWIAGRVSADTVVRDESAEWAMLAVQGPHALAVLAGLGIADLRETEPFRHRTVRWRGTEIVVATTGYTGESGAELLVAPDGVALLWDALLADERVVPCGLAARDTLRLEVCYPLHGNDIAPDTSAVGAGLGWVCGWGTGFIGEDVLAAERAAGPVRRLRPIEMTGTGIPRAGCSVNDGAGHAIGSISSGTISPMSGRGIGLGWVDADQSAFETDVAVDIRGTLRPARVVRAPFHHVHKESA